MSLGRRHWMTTAAATLALLAAPVAAQAATYTVAAGNGPCGAADTACESLTAAAAVAVSGDAVQVAPGTYNESPTFGAPGVTITGSTTAPGVVVTGTITFSGSGAPASVLQKLVVATTAAGAPAVNVTGTAGAALRDAFLISSGGAGVALSNGVGNEITRSTVLTGVANGNAVDIATATSPVTLALSSSILSGGASGAGLAVRTGVGLLVAPGTAGAANISAHHITIAGSANAIALDASAATSAPGGAAAGSIAATVADSIVLGNVSQKNNPGAAGLPLLGGFLPANTATVDLATRNDRTSSPAALFVNASRRNFHLRADAPAIDKGLVTTADSATDVDGQPRVTGAAADLGADEFVNTPPTASIVVRTARPRANQPVLLDGTGSTDREAGFGGGIVAYQWAFGDGTTETTTTPTVLHTYKAEGSAAAQLVVVDRQGAASAPAAARIDVGDGVPPVATITKPFANQRIKLTTTTTKTVTKNGQKTKVTTRKKTKIAFAGAAKDKAGVALVVLTIEKIGAATSSTATKASQTTASKAQCTWFDAKKGLLKTSCTKPKLLLAKLAKDGAWTFTPSSKTKRLSAGLYRVSVYAADSTGAFGNSAPTKDRIVRFRLTK